MAQWERRRVLVTVKAAPQVGKKHGESVCVAGIDLDRKEWIRLYPCHFRELPFERRFSKYQVIEVDVRKASDARRESYTPNEDTISPFGEPLRAGESTERRAHLLPLAEASMCAIKAAQQRDGTSLGLFRQPEAPDLIVSPNDQEWHTLYADQGDMLNPHRVPLERPPYRFSFRYSCTDEGCPGHEQTIADWEISEVYRGWRRSRTSDEATIAAIRDKWSGMWAPEREPYIFTGNMVKFPWQFLVLGVFYPRCLKDVQP